MSTLTPTFNGAKWEVSQVIPNATIEPYPQNNDATTMPSALKITPNTGYVLHNKDMDYTDFESVYNEETGETTENEIFKRGYTGRFSVCGANYDFTPLQITLECGEVTAYGSQREFAAVLETSVPGNQIFGGGTAKPPTEKK